MYDKDLGPSKTSKRRVEVGNQDDYPSKSEPYTIWSPRPSKEIL